MAKRVAKTTKRATVIGSVEAAKAHIWYLQGEARAVSDNVASMKHDLVSRADAEGWDDALVIQLDDSITYWEGRYRALLAQIVATRTLLATLQEERAAAQTA